MKAVAPCSYSKAEEMSGRGYRFLMVMSLRPLKSMQGWRVLSFFSTKKKPGTARDKERQVIPAANDSWM